MSEDLRTDHVKLESPSILTKKILSCSAIGGWAPWASLVYASQCNFDTKIYAFNDVHRSVAVFKTQIAVMADAVGYSQLRPAPKPLNE